MSTLNREREFVLCTLGTQGDISPFLAIGSALAARGHRVTILSNEHWREQVAACGAGFAAIAPRDPPQSGRDNFAFFHSNVVPSFHESFRYIEQRVARGNKVVVLFKAGMLGAQCAAEKLGLRHIKVALQPSAIRSVLRPAWPLTKLAQGRWGALARSTLIPLIYRTTELLGRYRRVTNAYRRAHGLRPMGLGETNRTEDVMLLLCPQWFAMPQSDWPANCRFAGFAFTPAGELDAELRDFIAARGPPLVFTPGTGVTDTQSFFRMASEVCRALAAPGIFLSAEMHEQWLAENILCRRYVDLGALLPQRAPVVASRRHWHHRPGAARRYPADRHAQGFRPARQCHAHRGVEAGRRGAFASRGRRGHRRSVPRHARRPDAARAARDRRARHSATVRGHRGGVHGGGAGFA